MGHHGQNIHGHHDVETIIGKAHVGSIHLDDVLDVKQPFFFDALPRPLQHLRRKIDRGNAERSLVVRQRTACPDSNFQHPALELIDIIDRPHSAPVGHLAEGKIINRSPPLIGSPYRFLVQINQMSAHVCIPCQSFVP